MQFGFRANHSTETACCYFLEVIKSSLGKGVVVGAIFLGLCKAFDAVNHSALLSKLLTFILSWCIKLGPVLPTRLLSVCVWINDKILCILGAPQGSVLGPLLFSAYVYDLPSVCGGLGTLMCVDDTVLNTCGKDPKQVAAKLSLTMEKVSQRLEYSHLTLNTNKTNQRNMVLDPNLTLKSHIKAWPTYNLSNFRYIRISLTTEASKTCFNATILP